MEPSLNQWPDLIRSAELRLAELHDATLHGIESTAEGAVLVISKYSIWERVRVKIPTPTAPMVVSAGLLIPMTISHCLVCVRSAGVIYGSVYGQEGGYLAGRIALSSEEPELFQRAFHVLQQDWVIAFVAVVGDSFALTGKGELSLESIQELRSQA